MFIDARLWALTRPARGSIAACVAIGVLASVTGIVRLGLLGWLLLGVFQGDGAGELAGPALAVAAVMVARGALEHWRKMMAHRTAARLQLALRSELHDQVLRLGPAHFGDARTGEVVLSMVEGVEQLEVWFGEYIPQLAVAALTPLVVTVLVAPLDLPVALVLLSFALVTLVAPAAFHRWDAANSLRRQRAYAAFAADFLDSLQGLATLKAFGQSEARGRVLAQRAHDVFDSTMWVLATNSLTRGITDTGLALGAATALGLGAYRVQSGAMDIGTLLIILMAGIEVFRPQRELRSLLHNGMMGMSAAQGIFAVLDAQPRVTHPTAPVGGGGVIEPRITFEDVTFAYPGSDDPALRGLVLDVAPGERVGVVGSSGSGKSTMVKLLLRHHDPQAGRVALGGHPLTELASSDLYGSIAVVSQDAVLFHGTVLDNIRFGRPDADLDEVMRAARDANAHEFVTALPEGYDTVIGERGIRLSGGQRQRIAIARALLRDAPVLVLDEALSSVDARNEAVIQQALDRLMAGRTTLILAHRLSSVIGADRIVVLDHGQVAESGTHDELMEHGGRYRALMADQVTTAGARQIEGVPDGQPSPAAGDEPSPDARSDGGAPDDIVRAVGLGRLGAIRWLMTEVRPWRARLAAVVVFGVTRVAALIGVGVLSALVVGAVRRGDPFGWLLVALGVAAPMAGIVHWLESWIAHDMAFRMLAEMRIALFARLDQLAPAYLVRRRTGDLVAMATHDVEMVEYFFAHTVAPAFVAVAVPLVVLIALAVTGWPMALALLPFLALVAASPVFLRRRLDELGSRDREALADLNAVMVDTVQGLAEVQAFEQSQHRAEVFLDRARRHIEARRGFYRDLSLQTSLLEAVTGLGGLAVLVAGAQLVEAGNLGPTTLPLLTLLALAAFLPVSEIAQVGRQLADTLGAARRLHQVHAEPAAVTSPLDPVPLVTKHPVAVSFTDVRFTYPGTTKAALDGVTFDIAAGSRVALAGPSGAGKTTAAQLMLRFWDPDQGEIHLFGQPLTGLSLPDLRASVALVSQETFLFNDTIGNNVLMARPSATREELHAAIARASLDAVIGGLPDGIDTGVGERGVRLSGGQRQRVAIARAFLKDAPVLVLDEATSHLDAINEAAVHQALDELSVGRTTLVIAHRLSTVRDADAIVVMEAGGVAEVGTHDELLAAGGLYARLTAHQLAAAAGASTLSGSAS